MSPLLTDGWATAEKSGGTPKVLFTFAIGARMWRYAQASSDVTVSSTGLTYKAAQMEVGSDVERREEIGPQRVTVRMGIRTDIVASLRAQQTERMYLGIHRYHASAGSIARWAFGEIASVRVKRGWCYVELQTEEAALEQDVPRAIFAPQCQKSTYSPECGVNADDFAFTTNITLVDGRNVTVAGVGGQPDDYFTDGLLKLGNSFYNISKQTSTSLRLFQRPPRGLTLPAAVTLYAGDDLTHETCRDKFNNLDAFLGFKWLPAKNPSLDLEHRGPDILATTHEPPTPGGYTRPAQILWYRGDVATVTSNTIDGSGNVSQLTDASGNARHTTQGDAAARPGYLAPTLPAGQSPPQESDGVGFGPAYHIGAGYGWLVTMLMPSLSAYSAIDWYWTIRLDKEDPTDPVDLAYIAASGNGQGQTRLLPGRKLQIGFGLGGTGRFTMDLPAYSLAGRDVVLNVTATAARYNVRLDNSLIFTSTPGDSYYGLLFNGVNYLGGSIGDAAAGFVHRRMVMYPAALSNEDRAITYGYMKTGIGAPV